MAWLDYECLFFAKSVVHDSKEDMAAQKPGEEKRESRLQDFTWPFYSRISFASRTTDLAKEVLHLSLGENRPFYSSRLSDLACEWQ